MKKTLWILTLVLGMSSWGVSQAYAVPAIDGVITGAEWTNNGTYPYYLEVFDINEELGNNANGWIPDAYDISHVVLLQELNAFGGDGDPDTVPLTGAGDNDGIYILIEVYGLNPTLEDADGSSIVLPKIGMSGDFNGDGVEDITLIHSTTATDGSGQSVFVNNILAAISGDLVAAGGKFTIVDGGRGAINLGAGTGGGGTGACGAAFGGVCPPLTLVVEYFIPTGAFGTPIAPFPSTFIGKLIYDNGGDPADDVVMGTLIPEPSTMTLFGSAILGLLGLAGYRRRQALKS